MTGSQLVKSRFPASLILGVFILAAAGCQSGGGQGPMDLGLGGGQEAEEPPEDAVRESELRAYCPPVTLREGTAYYNVYADNAEGDPGKVVYQAAISEVTRSCQYDQGSGRITVAIAGKVVPGPAGRTGTVTMPIRVAAMRGEEVVYSELHRHAVEIDDTSGATQFVFKDSDVVIPGGIDLGVRLYAGYDEGPYDNP